ncbi:hypothetical protein [Streptomyces silvensis]|uniref:Uncharacterized protein n=1 Tax=Streptomyces silvensis TaxID=1765722 RepID=A0A0W7X9R4_9ACTN|nr:hypothetical protein [Streptomyces silvensis]KUF19592.1 hypothetical protein AT728_04260 [Streptomyces silvensis]
MAFPDTSLGVRVELLLGETWLDITGDVFTDAPVAITRGRPDEGARTDAASCAFVLDNRTGRYSPRNPSSDLYGLLGRNTPMRVSVAPYGADGPRSVRFVGEVAAWPVRWGTPHDVAVSVAAAGILRRLGQGTKPLDSTLRRRIPSAAPRAYWPMEEAREATRAFSPIPGVRPAAVTGLEFGAVDTLPSSLALPRLTSAATLSAIVPSHDAAGQWQVEFVYNADGKVPPGDGEWAEVIGVSTTGTVRRWVVGMRDGAARLYGYDSSGTDVIFRAVGVGSDVWHGWVRIRLWARDDGTTVTYQLLFQNIGGDAGALNGTLAANTSAGRVTAVTATWGPRTEGWSIGHLAILRSADSWLYYKSDAGYAGETAWRRMARLAEEEGIPVARVAGPLTTERVGPQRPQTLLAVLESAADADGGLLLEDHARIGLLYRDRSTLYTQQPALTLAYGQPGLAAPLEPVDDDGAVRNDITVSREGGSSARAVLESGPLSVQSPPHGIGLYDESVTLVLDNDVQPEQHAHWRLHLGTVDGARFPAVSVMLHKAPHLIPAVLALREGDMIRLTGLPPWVSHDPVDLIVQGWRETLDQFRWDVTYTCSPAAPWNVAKADHPVFGKADTDGCRLLAPATSTAPVLEVVSAGLPWTSDPAEMPLRLQLGGETVHATAVVALGDTFGRTVTDGWGTAANGLAWSAAGGAASDRSVDGARGVIALASSVSSLRAQTLLADVRDCEVRVRIQPGQVSTGGGLIPGVLLRYASIANSYRVRLHLGTGGDLALSVARGSTQVGSTTQIPGGYAAGQEIELRARIEGHRIRARAWKSGAVEPLAWQADVTVTESPIDVGAVGLCASGFSANTNPSPVVRFDAFEVVGGQRLTVTRSANGVVKSHATGTDVRLSHPTIASL